MPDSKASQEKTETGILEKLKERDLHPFLTYYAYNHMAGKKVAFDYHAGIDLSVKTINLTK